MAQDTLNQTWLESDRRIPARFVRPLRRFTAQEASSGIVLLIATGIALIWANFFGDSYEEFWETEILVDIGGFEIHETLREIVNDGLMTLFFFVVGLEIKRELRVGELRDRKTAALPAMAAIGGMVLPALIYFAFNTSGEASQGWGIPMATDIAFSLGVVALLGSRVPIGAKLFLLALAIVDDIGAIAVIAIFYTDSLEASWLLFGLAAFAFVWGAKRNNVRSLGFYWVLGFFIWFAVLESGVHATLAGVALGLLTPTRPFYTGDEFDRRARRTLDQYPADESTVVAREHVDFEAMELSQVARESVSPLNRLEEALHPWTSYVVVPLFALANAGVRLVDFDLGEAVTDPVTLGVAIGLVVGKTVGITFFSWLAVRLGLGVLPRGTGWGHIVGLAAMAGIGFTVSLFITGLAFDDPALSDLAKIGIFIGSAIAGVVGYLILRRLKAPT